MTRVALQDIQPVHAEWIMQMVRSLKAESPVYQSYDHELELAEQRVHGIIADPRFYGVIATALTEDGIVPVGYMFGHYDEYWYSGQRIFLEDSLYVIPEYRGTLTAARMIKRVVACLRATGNFLSIRAGATTGLNDERTIRLYEALGFELQPDGTVSKEL